MSPSSKGVVLVVDDDLRFVKTMQAVLEEEGYRVVATVGAQALQVAPALQPDVILLDIMMPGMDGVEVSQRLRADSRTAAIPLVAISADPVRIYSLLMLIDDRLSKPFKNEDLYAILARLAPSQ